MAVTKSKLVKNFNPLGSVLILFTAAVLVICVPAAATLFTTNMIKEFDAILVCQCKKPSPESSMTARASSVDICWKL